jgi:hypothetical protein
MTISLYLPLRTYPDPVEEGMLPAVIGAARHIGASITGAAVEVDIPPVKNKLAEAILHLQEPQSRRAAPIARGCSRRLWLSVQGPACRSPANRYGRSRR